MIMNETGCHRAGCFRRRNHRHGCGVEKAQSAALHWNALTSTAGTASSKAVTVPTITVLKDDEISIIESFAGVGITAPDGKTTAYMDGAETKLMSMTISIACAGLRRDCQRLRARMVRRRASESD